MQGKFSLSGRNRYTLKIGRSSVKYTSVKCVT